MFDRYNISFYLFCIICYQMFILNVVSFEIDEMEKYSLSTSISTAAAYLIDWASFKLSYIWIFVTPWFYWLLPEATAENHPFLFESIPCLSKWHPFKFSDVTTVAKALHSLWQIIMMSVWHNFGQTLKKLFFFELVN